MPDNVPQSTKSERLVTRVTPEMKQAVEQAARTDRRNTNEWMRNVIEDALSKNNRRRKS